MGVYGDRNSDLVHLIVIMSRDFILLFILLYSLFLWENYRNETPDKSMDMKEQNVVTDSLQKCGFFFFCG